jgi:type IV secretory pathway VirB2 component (pilin)
MSRKVTAVLYVAVMAVVIVGVDLAFFNHHFWPRMAVNGGIVLVFVAYYLRFIGRPWAPWK